MSKSIIKKRKVQLKKSFLKFISENPSYATNWHELEDKYCIYVYNINQYYYVSFRSKNRKGQICLVRKEN